MLVDLIVDSNLSFNVAQSPTLRVLLETVCGRKLAMPTRYKFMSTLNTKIKQTKAELKERIALQKYICLTADVWTSRAQSYLGVTCHFINENFKRESYLLAFKQLEQRQTYDILAKAMNDIIKDWGIKISQITNIVTDGGSAFCKMFKKYGDSIDVIVLNTDAEEIEQTHDENDSEANAIADSEVDVIQEYMLDQNGEEFFNEILTFDPTVASISQTVYNEPNLDDDYHEYFEEMDLAPSTEQSEIKLPPQRRCVSHMLNLVPKDFESNLDGMAKSAFKKTFDALHSLWVIVRTSARAKTICRETLGATLKYPCETRWNSKLDCIKQCNEPGIQRKLNDLIQKLKNSLNSNTAMQLRLLNNNDFIVMVQYEKVFGPIAVALDILQGEFDNS